MVLQGHHLGRGVGLEQMCERHVGGHAVVTARPGKELAQDHAVVRVGGTRIDRLAGELRHRLRINLVEIFLEPVRFAAMQFFPQPFRRFPRRGILGLFAFPDLLEDLVEQRQHGQLGVLFKCGVRFAGLVVKAGQFQEHNRVVGELPVSIAKDGNRLGTFLGRSFVPVPAPRWPSPALSSARGPFAKRESFPRSTAQSQVDLISAIFGK